MKIVCVGGGPAGLYFASLMKRRDENHDITVLERNPAGSTYGWGVTYWQSLLDKLRATDPETAGEIRENSFRWADTVVDRQGRQTVIRGNHGFSISRRLLIDILSRRAMELGIDVQFEREVEDLSGLPDADLIVACDGVNSRLRRLHADSFGTDVVMGRNKYVWLGTSKVFGAFTFAFAETDAGWIWFYAYGFNGQASTVIVECSLETWTGLGFDTLGAEGSDAVLGRIFEGQLDGHPLLNGVPYYCGAPWLNFPTVTNHRWHHDNIVLVGDSAHTTHYSIGSGTIRAIEDAIALTEKLCEHTDLESALDMYEKERKQAIIPLQGWARYSAQWYENLPRYIHLQAPQFTALLRERRSPILPHLPPLVYYLLYQIVQGSSGLQKVRERLGPTLVRAGRGRRSAQWQKTVRSRRLRRRGAKDLPRCAAGR
jgi:2-polyprenyl-6-methoxyphenol hydroxylase-like FAD-dependent oxidoreductase